MFESDPHAPVTRNCASGYFRESKPMNGIDPPMPAARCGCPKTSSLTVRRAVVSHGASVGAFQPSSACGLCPKVTFAPYGTSVVRAFLTASRPFSASAVGGSRKLRVSVVFFWCLLLFLVGFGLLLV